MEVLFYGVRAGNTAGHYFYGLYHGTPYAVRSAEAELELPPSLIKPSPDGRWCDPNNLREGCGSLTHLDGWTIISWWDRSGDSRPGSCAVFFVEGTYSFAEALDAARSAFAKELHRMESAYVITNERP